MRVESIAELQRQCVELQHEYNLLSQRKSAKQKEFEETVHSCDAADSKLKMYLDNFRDLTNKTNKQKEGEQWTCSVPFSSVKSCSFQTPDNATNSL